MKKHAFVFYLQINVFNIYEWHKRLRNSKASQLKRVANPHFIRQLVHHTNGSAILSSIDEHSMGESVYRMMKKSAGPCCLYTSTIGASIPPWHTKKIAGWLNFWAVGLGLATLQIVG